MTTRGLGSCVRPLCLLAAMSLVGVVITAQQSVPRYEVKRAAAPPTIDGKLEHKEPHLDSVLVDTDAKVLTLGRVAYDVASAQAKILAADLPVSLAQRLAIGR